MADHITDTRSVNSIVALVMGAIYTLVGIAGFFISETFAEQDDETLLGFEVNNLHNVVHLLIGLALLAASRRLATARPVNMAIGIVYVALGVLGPLMTGTDANVLALNDADHWLHIVSGLVLAGVAAFADKGVAVRRRTSV